MSRWPPLLLLLALGCAHAPPAAPPFVQEAPPAGLFDGCQASSADHTVVTIRCADRQVCQVAPRREGPEEALAAFIKVEAGTGRRADDAQGPLLLLPGSPDGAIAVRTLAPWVSQVVACTGTARGPAATSPRFQWMRAHGMPSMRALMDDWAPAIWQGRNLALPNGCLSSPGDGGFRVSCGVDHLVLVRKAGGAGTAAAFLARGTLDAVSVPRTCTLDGHSAACRLDILSAAPADEAPYQLLAAYDDGDALVIARCAWAAGPEIPALCAQVLRVGP